MAFQQLQQLPRPLLDARRAREPLLQLRPGARALRLHLHGALLLPAVRAQGARGAVPLAAERPRRGQQGREQVGQWASDRANE